MRNGIGFAFSIAVLILVAVGCKEKQGTRVNAAPSRQDKEGGAAREEEGRKTERARHESALKAYEREIAALKAELVEARVAARQGKSILPAPTLAVAPQAVKKAAAPTPVAAQTGAEPAAPSESAQALLEFAKEYEQTLPEESREKFMKDIAEYLAAREKQKTAAALPERKRQVLDDLRQKAESETEESERKALESRIAQIEGASDEDLLGILDYYERLDGNLRMSALMEEYRISREDLLRAGIDPPPRSRWGPDIAEVTSNLSDFVNAYAPLTPAEEREQYRRDFGDLISALGTRPTEAELLQKRDQMLSGLREQAAAAESEARKRRLARQIERLEKGDMGRVQRELEMDKLREIGALAQKYGIPADELRQSGVISFGRNRFRR